MNASAHIHDFHALRARAMAPVDVSTWHLLVWASTGIVLFLLSLTFCCPRRSRAPEPIAALAFVPALLDEFFGGNRRERLLYPYRFTSTNSRGAVQ